MSFWKRSIRQGGHPHRASTKTRGPSRKRRLQLENLDERALLSTYTLSETFLPILTLHQHGVWKVVETVNNVTTTYVDPPSPFVVSTGNGSNTVNILNTSAGIPINVIVDGTDTVNVGSNGSVQGILAPVSIRSEYDVRQITLNVDDSADATARTVMLYSFTPAGDSTWGTITGLAPAAINYRYFDISSLHVTTGLGADRVDVLATGVPTYLSSSGGADTVNVGVSGGPDIGAGGIQGTLYVENPPWYTTLNIYYRYGETYTITTFTPGPDPGPWGSITGLSPAAIDFAWYDIRQPNFIPGSFIP
jgi:hypothetical protein